METMQRNSNSRCFGVIFRRKGKAEKKCRHSSSQRNAAADCFQEDKINLNESSASSRTPKQKKCKISASSSPSSSSTRNENKFSAGATTGCFPIFQSRKRTKGSIPTSGNPKQSRSDSFLITPRIKKPCDECSTDTTDSARRRKSSTLIEGEVARITTTTISSNVNDLELRCCSSSNSYERIGRLSSRTASFYSCIENNNEGQHSNCLNVPSPNSQSGASLLSDEFHSALEEDVESLLSSLSPPGVATPSFPSSSTEEMRMLDPIVEESSSSLSAQMKKKSESLASTSCTTAPSSSFSSAEVNVADCCLCPCGFNFHSSVFNPEFPLFTCPNVVQDSLEEGVMLARACSGRWETIIERSGSLDSQYRCIGLGMVKRAVMNRLAIQLTMFLEENDTIFHCWVHTPLGIRHLRSNLCHEECTDDDPDAGRWTGITHIVDFSIPWYCDGKPVRAIQQRRSNPKVGTSIESRCVLPDEKEGKVMLFQFLMIPKGKTEKECCLKADRVLKYLGPIE